MTNAAICYQQNMEFVCKNIEFMLKIMCDFM